MNTFSPPKDSFIEHGRRYLWIRVNVMQHYGDKFLCSLKTKVPVEFVDFKIGWSVDMTGLNDELYARYPHLIGRKDIQYCVEDIQTLQPPIPNRPKNHRLWAG